MSEVLPVTSGDVSLPNNNLISNALAPNVSAPPVVAQRSSHHEAAKLESEKVTVAAPLSYAGSAARIWRLTGLAGVNAHPSARVGLAVLAIHLTALAWVFVTAWYLTWGLLLVPYRLIRRGQRKDRRQALQHREMLSAINQQR
jgi:hypothetical protein